MINYSIAIMGTKPGTKKENITETKAYGNSQCASVMTLDSFCEHIASHGSCFSRGTIQGVALEIVDCLREQLLDGKLVQLGKLGSFRVELKTKGAVDTEDFSAANIEKVNVRWNPGKDFMNLRNSATFQLVPSRLAQANAQKEIKNQETIHGLE
ncbi:MAG: DNA-binding protein [Bacteroidaceae bacterium]|nr:DNA-binding protein [Bacteroidaceae bacterium]